MTTSLYNTKFREGISPNNPTLPQISTELDSVRMYQFEVRFTGLPDGLGQNVDDFITLAAKQVESVNYGVDDLAVHRVNDIVYYPGKPTFEPVTVTFDNLLVQKTSIKLWEWFNTVYNPMTGNLGNMRAARNGTSGRSAKAAKMTIYELSHDKTPINSIDFYGVYPKSINFSEKNYSQQEFSTMAVQFRYDYLNYKSLTSVGS